MSAAIAIPTGTLIDITDHLQALFETVEGLEPGPLREEAEAELARYVESEIRKVDAVNSYLSTCENQQAWAKAEIERLQARKSAWESREQRVRDMVQSVMERMGVKKLEGRTGSFSLRASPASVLITDEGAIPEEFIRVTVYRVPDKKAIKKAIDEGREVDGCDLTMGKQTLVRK